MLMVGFVGRVRDCTVTGMLQAAGLAGEWHHSRGHDFFARRRWDPDDLGLRLLDFLVPKKPRNSSFFSTIRALLSPTPDRSSLHSCVRMIRSACRAAAGSAGCRLAASDALAGLGCRRDVRRRRGSGGGAPEPPSPTSSMSNRTRSGDLVLPLLERRSVAWRRGAPRPFARAAAFTDRSLRAAETVLPSRPCSTHAGHAVSSRPLSP